MSILLPLGIAAANAVKDQHVDLLIVVVLMVKKNDSQMGNLLMGCAHPNGYTNKSIKSIWFWVFPFLQVFLQSYEQMS